MDEVMDPSLVIYGEGFFKGGLILYIFFKIKDTIYGEKNITLLSNLAQVKRKNSIVELAVENYKVLNIKNYKALKINNIRSFHTKVKASKRIGPHNEDVLSVLVGSLLGNGYCKKRSVEGTRFCLRQNIINKEYLFFLYDFFLYRGYSSNLKPILCTRVLRDKEVFCYEFNIFTFRSLNWLYDLFYHRGKKRITPILVLYLTPLALAVWIMDVGEWDEPGVRIPTCNFSSFQIVILQTILFKVYGLDCKASASTKGFKSSIYIKKNSVPKLKRIVSPHMHSSMCHKIGINF